MGASNPGTGEYAGGDYYDDPSANPYGDPSAYPMADMYTDQDQMQAQESYPEDGQQQPYPGASGYHDEYTYPQGASNPYASNTTGLDPEQEQHRYYTGTGEDQFQDASGEGQTGAYPDETYDSYPAYGAATDRPYDQSYDHSTDQAYHGEDGQDYEQSYGEDEYSHGQHQQGYADTGAPNQEMHTAVQAY